MLKGVLGMEKEKGYRYYIRCKNCRYRVLVTIPMGVTVEEFTMEYEDKCPRCGVCDWESAEPL